MHSARRNHPEIMELLLCQPGVDINTPDNSVLVGGTPLHWAVSGGSARMVEMLLKQPNLECLDARDVHGYTPLMLAVGSGSCDLISLLMKRMLDDHRQGCIIRYILPSGMGARGDAFLFFNLGAL